MVGKVIKLPDFKVVALIISIIAITVSVICYAWQPAPGSLDYTHHYTHYNNFLLFKYSFYHLLHHTNLYLEVYPGENHFDLFKYSPAFALFMAPFAVLPNLVGLILWNMLNGIVLFYAFRKFPFKSEKYKLLAFGFIIIEAVTAIENAQSNCLIAGMIILAFLAMEKRNIAISSLLIISCAFIKIFGLAALVLFLFFPGKLKAAIWSLLWILIFTLVPVIITGTSGLVSVYHDWWICLSRDYSISWGFSVMAWLDIWFGIKSKGVIMLSGLIIFLLPLFRVKAFQIPVFRQLFLASVLIWVVIFNYKAESPTFIIAVSGIAIWFFIQEYKKVNLFFLLCALVFTVLIATVVFPTNIQQTIFIPYVVKVVPCALVWLKLTYDLLTINFTHFAPQNLTKLQPNC